MYNTGVQVCDATRVEKINIAGIKRLISFFIDGCKMFQNPFA